jgi:hypothetical protein
MNVNYNSLERRRSALLKKIGSVGPFLMASATYPKIRCGNPNCACATDPEKRHEKMHLSWMEAGSKSGTQYVPVDLREEVLKWIENYWQLKEYQKEMSDISRQMIGLYAKSKRHKPAKKKQ